MAYNYEVSKPYCIFILHLRRVSNHKITTQANAFHPAIYFKIRYPV